MQFDKQNTMKRTCVALVILLLTMAGTGQETRVLDRVSAKLREYGNVFPSVRIRMYTDKEIYAPGEMLWFSGFLEERTQNRLSGEIPEITVNLYDGTGHLVLGEKFSVSAGVFQGAQLLPEELPLGRYYLVAYTPLMTNPGQALFIPLLVDRFYESDAIVSLADPTRIYQSNARENIEVRITDFSGSPVDKFLLLYELRHGNLTLATGKVRSSAGKGTIEVRMPEKIGNMPVELLVSHPKNLWTKKFVLKNHSDEIKITFFPEGGNVIPGLPQKLGYYATVWGDVPVGVEADIVNSSGQVITKTRSFMAGFGIIPFQPAPGEQYRLVVTGDYGKGLTFPLPPAGMERYALTVFKIDDEFITVDILTDQSVKESISVTATRGTQLLWAAETEVAGVSRIRIPVSMTGSGIVLLSLFDHTGKVVSSRLVSVPSETIPVVDIAAELQDDDKVKITVQSRDEEGNPLPASVILSVADQMRYVHKETIAGKGCGIQDLLENRPPAYIQPERAALDYMLISNRLSGFDWNHILRFSEGVSSEISFNNMGISGLVTDKKGTAVPGAKVSIMDTRDMQLYSATTDPDGRFAAPSVQVTDIHDFRISATPGNGRGNLHVITDPTFAERVGEQIRTLDLRFTSLEAHRHQIAAYLASNPDLLMEQPVVKPLATGGVSQRNESYKNLLQTATNLIDVIKMMKPFTLINGQIVFHGTHNSILAQSGALIVVDGQKMGTQVEVLNSISPFDVDKINISLDPMEIQRYTGFNNVGIIEITTFRGSDKLSSVPAAVQKETLRDGSRVPRSFLTTDAILSRNGKDLRTTLFWDPALKTGPEGLAVFSIPLSDITSGFVIRAILISAGDPVIGAVKDFGVKRP